MSDEALERLTERLERLINERHARLVDQTTAIIHGLHEDLIGVGHGQDNLSQQIAELRSELRPAIADLWSAIADLRARVAAVEQELSHGR